VLACESPIVVWTAQVWAVPQTNSARLISLDGLLFANRSATDFGEAKRGRLLAIA